jgi:hypothetical protein
MVFSLVPIFITAIYILRLGLNIPFWDQWEVVHLLAKSSQGVLTIAELFSQHNEHRPFFPRLIWIGLSGVTHYNVNAELWGNFLIALGTFWFLVNRSMATWRRMGVFAPPWLVPLMSLLVFNLGQRESWLQGYQTVMFLGAAGAVIGLIMAAEDGSGRGFLVAVLLGIISTFSMANGVLYWPVGLAVLATGRANRWKAAKLYGWTAAGAMCIALFFHGWVASVQLSLSYVLAHPLEWILWVANYVGAPLMTSWYVAWMFGIIGIGLYIAAAGYAVRNGKWRSLTAYFAVAAFVLLAALSTSIGRAGLGMPQSVVPRYLTVSVWFWISLLTLLTVVPMKILYRRVLYTFLTMSLTILTVVGGWRGYVSIYQRILPAYLAVSSGQVVNDGALGQIHPDPAIARSDLQFLCENRLSACADAP